MRLGRPALPEKTMEMATKRILVRTIEEALATRRGKAARVSSRIRSLLLSNLIIMTVSNIRHQEELVAVVIEMTSKKRRNSSHLPEMA